MFGMMIDSGPKFYSVPSTPPMHDLKAKVTDLEHYDGFGSCLVR